MKTFLKPILSALLFCASTMASAAYPEGEWTIQLWSDTGTPLMGNSYRLCVKSGGNMYFSPSPDWQGKWFMKGNDLHLTSIHASGLYSTTLNMSKINDTTFSGYYQWIGYTSARVPTMSEFATALVTFNQPLCTF